jgi:hypothetical protein
MRLCDLRKHDKTRRPGMDCRDPGYMDVSGGVLRAWMPAILARTTEALRRGIRIVSGEAV